MRKLLVALVLAAVPGAGFAENRALVIGNSSYRTVVGVPGAEDAARAVGALQVAGFRVDQGRDMTIAQMRAALSRMMLDDGGNHRLVIMLAGHFVRSGQGTWFLGSDAGGLDLGTVGGAGLDLDTVLEIAAQAPGEAIVLLGDSDRRNPVGPGLGYGIGTLDVPQGVTVVRGLAADVAEVLRDGLLRPGAIPGQVLDQHPDVAAEGFVSYLTPFLTGVAGPDPNIAAELAAWQAAQARNTITGYESFLRDWPRGRNADAAQAAITRLRSDPSLRAQEAEAALNLSRDARRAIQGALSLLGFDTRGVDGIFGPGSRDAIRRWQQANGNVATGYITGPEIQTLSAQADRLAAERAAAAEARRRELERADRAFWTETGAGRDEAALRAYLRRYPDGLYSDQAETRLSAIVDERQRASAARERTAWQAALAAGTLVTLQGYLRDFPDGAFADEAQARIDRLTENRTPSPEARAAREAEAALGLTAQLRQVLEERLLRSGFDPGPRDGVFDAATRRAIRQYQGVQGLQATGFLDAGTIAMLMLSTMGRSTGP